MWCAGLAHEVSLAVKGKNLILMLRMCTMFGNDVKGAVCWCEKSALT
ncbi:hypothetical protein HMPREF9997_01039, partial [Corynebacterium durum F0235]